MYYKKGGCSAGCRDNLAGQGEQIKVCTGLQPGEGGRGFAEGKARTGRRPAVRTCGAARPPYTVV